jgi:D-alanyl-D-alanine carboxypeptidase
MKPLVSVVVLQMAERGRLSLDAPLPHVLPARVTRRFANASGTSVRMLLGHRSGIPEWITPAVIDEITHHPARVWEISEILDLAAAQPPLFAPGAGYSYSNTNYNLLGLIIEHLTGQSWRHEVSRRLIAPLGLTHTTLPADGNRSIIGRHAHAYGDVAGKTVDFTGVSPSMAGAAGGAALVTTVQDTARFLDALLTGSLFRHRHTLQQMLAFAPAPDVGGQVGYGLGIERRLLPGGVEAIGHLGISVGYCAFVARLRAQRVTMSLALNWAEDPSPLLVPAVQTLAATAR